MSLRNAFAAAAALSLATIGQVDASAQEKPRGTTDTRSNAELMQEKLEGFNAVLKATQEALQGAEAAGELGKRHYKKHMEENRLPDVKGVVRDSAQKGDEGNTARENGNEAVPKITNPAQLMDALYAQSREYLEPVAGQDKPRAIVMSIEPFDNQYSGLFPPTETEPAVQNALPGTYSGIKAGLDAVKKSEDLTVAVQVRPESLKAFLKSFEENGLTPEEAAMPIAHTIIKAHTSGATVIAIGSNLNTGDAYSPRDIDKNEIEFLKNLDNAAKATPDGGAMLVVVNEDMLPIVAGAGYGDKIGYVEVLADGYDRSTVSLPKMSERPLADVANVSAYVNTSHTSDGDGTIRPSERSVEDATAAIQRQNVKEVLEAKRTPTMGQMEAMHNKGLREVNENPENFQQLDPTPMMSKFSPEDIWKAVEDASNRFKANNNTPEAEIQPEAPKPGSAPAPM